MNETFIFRLALVLFGAEIWNTVDEIHYNLSRRQFGKAVVLIVLLIAIVAVNGLHLFR